MHKRWGNGFVKKQFHIHTLHPMSRWFWSLKQWHVYIYTSTLIEMIVFSEKVFRSLTVTGGVTEIISCSLAGMTHSNNTVPPTLMNWVVLSYGDAYHHVKLLRNPFWTGNDLGMSHSTCTFAGCEQEKAWSAKTMCSFWGPPQRD